MADPRNIPTWEKLKELAAKSTEVVGWYAHGTGDGYHLGKASVRGPFGRWFIVEGGDNGMGDPAKYPTPVASLEDDAKYCAAAMNSVPALLEENERLRDGLERAREQLAMYKAMYSVQKCDEALATRVDKP